MSSYEIESGLAGAGREKGRGLVALEILIVLSPLVFVKALASAGFFDAIGLPVLVGYAGLIGTVTSVIFATCYLIGAGSSWRAVGLSRPVSWGKTILLGLGALLAIYLVSGLVVSSLIIAFDLPAPDTSRFDNVTGNFPVLLFWLAVSWIIGGFAEEMAARGYLLNRLAFLFGGGRLALALAVILQALLFGLGHAYQGATGVIVTGMVGLVMGIFYVLGRRSLWPVIIAHGLTDSIGFTAIYFGVAG